MPSEASLKLMREERKALEELATVNQITIRKLESERGGRAPLPDEALDKIITLENGLKLERANAEKDKREKTQLERQVKQQEKQIAKLTADLDEIKSETGWKRGIQTPAQRTVRTGADLENKVSELQLMLQKMEEEQRTNKQIQRKKTQLIETLSKELDSKKQLEEELFQAQNTIKVKDREIKEIMSELSTLKRVHDKKEKQLSTVEKDDTSLRHLEGDKRYLQSEIAKHTEARRQQERTIKAQQRRINQLQGRLESITMALKETRMDRILERANSPSRIREEDEDPEVLTSHIVPENEKVDVEVFEALQYDLDQQRNQLQVKEVMLQERDGTIEALEKKLDVLEHAKRTESRNILAERREFNYQIDDLKRALDIQQETYRKQADKLKQENARLRKKTTPEAA